MDTFGKVVSLSRNEATIYLQDKTEQGEVDGMPVMAQTPDDYVDPRDVETNVIGHCEMFDLSKETDRQNYADLLAKLECARNMVKYFEERTFSNTNLIVYVAYIEYLKIVK